MLNKEEVTALIKNVFEDYCDSFDKSLNDLLVWPWTDEKTVIHESNQVHRFLDAYQKTGDEIVTWMELPVYYKDNKQLAHIDAFIADKKRKLIFFIEAKRLSRKEQVTSLQSDVHRLFDIAHEIYVGDNRFKGLNLFDYDAYMIPLADVWDYRGEWCEKYASNWGKEVYDIESIYTYTLTTLSRTLDIPEEQEKGKYHLLGALMPVFDSEKYKEELELKRRKTPGEAADASILVYADDIPFEYLLASVNK